jgi:hypothetical protein
MRLAVGKVAWLAHHGYGAISGYNALDDGRVVPHDSYPAPVLLGEPLLQLGCVDARSNSIDRRKVQLQEPGASDSYVRITTPQLNIQPCS